MERKSNTQKAQKKQWTKPEIYLLDTTNINSGGGTYAHEKTLINFFNTPGGKKVGRNTVAGTSAFYSAVQS